MWNFVIGTTILKSLNPYFRKHVLNALTSDEFLLLNSLLILFIVFIIFAVKIALGKSHETLTKIINNYKKLSYSQFLCIFVLSLLTVISSLFLYELDKNYNTPLINTILLRIFSVVMLIIVGVFIFKEEYNWVQVFGIFLSVIGIFFIMQKPNKISNVNK
jgi:drug/metabolite transporter (DMT)-like permease